MVWALAGSEERAGCDLPDTELCDGPLSQRGPLGGCSQRKAPLRRVRGSRWCPGSFLDAPTIVWSAPSLNLHFLDNRKSPGQGRPGLRSFPVSSGKIIRSEERRVGK